MSYYFEVQRSFTITNTFQKFLDESNRKVNKIWVDKGSEFYNRSMKYWLEKRHRNENLLLLKYSLEP